MAKTKEKARGEAAAGPRARNDAYVMMLFVTLVALITATVLMYLDFEEYGSSAPPKEVIPAPAELGKALKLADEPRGPKVDDPKVDDPKVDPKPDPE